MIFVVALWIHNLINNPSHQMLIYFECLYRNLPIEISTLYYFVLPYFPLSICKYLFRRENVEISKSFIEIVNLLMVVPVEIRDLQTVELQEVGGEKVGSTWKESKPSLIYYSVFSERVILDETGVVSKEDVSRLLVY